MLIHMRSLLICALCHKSSGPVVELCRLLLPAELQAQATLMEAASVSKAASPARPPKLTAASPLGQKANE